MIKCILKFFGLVKDTEKQSVKVKDVMEKLDIPYTEPEKPDIYYEVYQNGKFLTWEKNLSAVSRVYPELKRSTLYDAFKEDNVERTYVKNKYIVVECQK